MMSRRSRTLVFWLALVVPASAATSAGAHRPPAHLSAPAAAAAADAANTKNPADRPIVRSSA